MSVTINSYIESLLNAPERFRTLRGVWPRTDSSGHPVFSTDDDYVRFLVAKDGINHSLFCPLRNENGPTPALADRILNINNRKNPHIAPCEYHSSELVVFDRSGNAVRRDVILCTYPDGLPVGRFIRSHLFSSDRRHFRTLLKNISAMAQSLGNDNITHGRLKPDNIIITAGGTPVAIDFAAVNNPISGNDSAMLALLALGIYLTGCEPEIFTLAGENYMFKIGNIAAYLRHIKAQLEFSGIGPALDIVAIIEKSVRGGVIAGVQNKAGISREEINDAIARLSATPFRDLSLLADMLRTLSGPGHIPYANKTDARRHNLRAGQEDVTLRIDFATCDYVGEISDSLVRFRKDGLWGYCDRHGKPLGSAKFHSAEDFYEGRAKVETGSGFGLIDREGCYVMPPQFDQLEWYGPENVAGACRDGIWGLYSRTGECISPERYDWLGAPDEGFFVARKGDKYAYIKINGQPLTYFRFDEAYSFRDGQALVTVGDESFHIDSEGRQIE